jgi:hypothetical protein
MTTVCIHQPDFAPWIGFFDRLVRSDIYVVLDNVQFLRRGWHHRDKIKTANGPRWLTVPVRKKGKFDQRIDQAEIDNSTNWPREHLNTLRANYARAPFFKNHIGEIEEIYGSSWTSLADLNMALVHLFMKMFGIGTQIRTASSLRPKGRSNELLVDILRTVGARRYLAGEGSRAYLDETLFNTHGIDVEWQSFRHPVYPQLHGDFVPGLSSFDFLLNCGSRECAQILRGQGSAQ